MIYKKTTIFFRADPTLIESWLFFLEGKSLLDAWKRMIAKSFKTSNNPNFQLQCTLALPTSSNFLGKILDWSVKLCLFMFRFIKKFFGSIYGPIFFPQGFWFLAFTTYRPNFSFAPTENIFDQQVLGGKLAFCVKIWAL